MKKEKSGELLARDIAYICYVRTDERLHGLMRIDFQTSNMIVV